MATTKPTYVDENGNVYTMLGNIRGPAGKDGINGKSIYANTVDPWSVSGWNPAVAGDLFLNTTTGILWSAKAGAVTSNVQSNWTKVGELAGKITVDSALSSTSTNPVQNKIIKSALDGKAGSSHSHSSLTNSSGRVFNVPTGGSGGEQKTLVITDDLNAYQPAGNYASSTHKHPISDINNLQSTIDGIHTDMGLQDEAIAGKADSVHTHEISNINGLQSALNGKSNLDHNHDSVYQAKGDYATNDTLKNYVTGTTFINYTTFIEGEVNKKANVSHDHDISDINGLQSALDGKSGVGHTHSEYVTGTDFSAYTNWIEGEVNGKSDIGHTHSISNVSGLQSALDGKSNTGHGHTISNITNLQSTIESIYSDIGLQDEAIAGKADSIHTHKISNIDGLQSALDGKSGVGHTHSKSEVGLGNVDNTADANKNVNYATSAGNADTLDGKHSSDFYLSNSNITNLPINGGIYWNPYVESSADGSDAASITVIKDGNGTGGTVLQIKQANDGNDIVNVVAGDLKLNGTSVSTTSYVGTYFPRAKVGSDSPYSDISTSFIGGVSGGPRINDWEFLYRAEHRNGSGDGPNYVMEMVSNLTYDSSIYWRKKTNGPFTSFREIIDSNNIGSQSVKYATTSHLLRTYNAGNGSHGEDYYLKCRHNVDGNDRFKLQIVRSDGSVTHSTSVDYANTSNTANYFKYGRGVSLPSSSSFTNNFNKDIFGEENNNNFHLVELRTSSQAPSCLLGDYSSGIAWKGSDTYGSLMVRYNTPEIRVSGGNGHNTNPNWTVDLVHSGNIGSQNVNYANSAGSARANNISMSFSNGVLTITYNS